MSEPFLAEVRMVGFNFAPQGWASCDGQLLPINQNQSLFSLLGTTYGGDGRTTFALPDLRGRTPLHVGTSTGANHTLGSRGGEDTHTLSVNEIPSHDHVAMGSSDTATQPVPTNNVLAGSAPNDVYHAATDLVPVRSGTVANTGASQAHNNMQPFAVVNFVIALVGLFPSRN